MWRFAALATAIAIAAIAYVALLHRAAELDLRGERVFGATTAATRVYIEPLAINAASDSMQVRVSILPGADRDFALLIGHDDVVEQIKVYGSQPASAATFDLNLGEGDVSAYPLDSYRARLWLRTAGAQGQPADTPPTATVWERVLGFRLQVSEQPGAGAGERSLVFEIRRGSALTFFVLAAYAAMAMLGIGAFTIGALVFLGVRKPESTLTGALAGIVFALPALRNALPGAAPLGVNADVYVFLWAELLAVCAIALLIFTWARSGPRP